MKIQTPRDLGAVVKGRRLELKLSQQQLADRSNVSRKWISDLEGGKPRAEFVLVIAVFEALSMELSSTVLPDKEKS